VALASGKTPYLRFDRNDYSIPPDRVRKPLTLIATPDEVRVLDGREEVARHRRSYDRGQPIEDPRHIAALVAWKQTARAPKARDALRAALPHAEAFFEATLERGLPLSSTSAQLGRLLADYGPRDTDAALAETLRRGTPTPSSVAHWLEQQRRRARARPAIPVELPDRPGLRDLRVTPHDLESYDDLSHADDEDAAG